MAREQTVQISGIVLDVNETLFSIAPMEQRFEAAGLDARDVDVWFARVLRDGFALAATDSAEAFRVIAEHHLEALLRAAGSRTDDGTVSRILGAFDEVEAHPDVAPGLQAAGEVGLTVATLTNGSAEITRGFLDRAGLSGLVGSTLEARASGVWKPHEQAYHWAAAQLGHELARLLLVAVHPWDVHGAVHAGMHAAWLDRDGEAYPDHFREPHLRAATLGQVIAAATGTG